MVNNFRRVFAQTKELEQKKPQKLRSSEDIVSKEDYLDAIVSDPYFTDDVLNSIVRVSVDQSEQENLGELLFRISTNHKDEKIKWDDFLSFFCRRGMLRKGEEMVFNYDDPRGRATAANETEQ